MCSYKQCLTSFREFEKYRDAEDILDFRDEIIPGQPQDVHGHFAYVEIDPQGEGRLKQFWQSRHVAAFHEAHHHAGTGAAEIEPAQREVVSPSQQEVEDSRQESFTVETPAGGVFLMVLSPQKVKKRFTS